MQTPVVTDLLTPGHRWHHPFEGIAALVYDADADRLAHIEPVNPPTLATLRGLPTRAEQRRAPDAARCPECGDARIYCGCGDS